MKQKEIENAGTNDHDSAHAELTSLRQVLSWPSGVDARVLAQCPHDQNFYSCLGTMVWITSMIAGLAAALMLSEAAGSALVAAGVGLFWATAVLNLERFLLVSIKQQSDNRWAKLLPIVRLGLSICIAIVVGEHVVQYFCRNEIRQELQQEWLDAQALHRNKATAAFPEIARLGDELKRKQRQFDDKEAEVRRLRDAYIKEAEGTAGSRIPGKGRLYEQKKTDYELVLAEKRQLEAELQNTEDQLQVKDNDSQALANFANAAKQQERGFLASHRALMRIMWKNPTLFILYAVISLGMMLFELTPLLSKLGRGQDSYDRLIQNDLDVQKVREDEYRQLHVETIKNDVERMKATAEKLAKLKRDALEAVVDSISKASDLPIAQQRVSLANAVSASLYADLKADLIPGSADDGDSPPSAQPYAVAVVPADELGVEPFVIEFEHPEKLLGRDLTLTVAALEERRANKQPGNRLDLCRATNSDRADIDPDQALAPQIAKDGTVYLFPKSPRPEGSPNNVGERVAV